MFDDFLNALLSILDISGTATGSQNKSNIFKILGIVIWALVIFGGIGLVVYWLQ